MIYRSSNKLLTDKAASYAVDYLGGCEFVTIIGTMNRYATEIKCENSYYDPRLVKFFKADLVASVLFSAIHFIL